MERSRSSSCDFSFLSDTRPLDLHRFEEIGGRRSFEGQSVANFPHNTLLQGLIKCTRVLCRVPSTQVATTRPPAVLLVKWKIQSSNPAGSPDNGNNRPGDRLPFQPPACTHKRPSGRRS